MPIRFISETLGLNVDWKDDSVYISGKFKTKGKRYNYEEDNKEEEIKKDNNSDRYLDQFNIPREKVQEGKESISIFQ